MGDLLEAFEELNDICIKVENRYVRRNWRDVLSIEDIYTMDYLLDQIKIYHKFPVDGSKQLDDIKRRNDLL